LIQGKHSKIVTDFLVAKGVPKRWLETSDLTRKK
jgi:translation initiation factor 2D